jgi:hypothetical protein
MKMSSRKAEAVVEEEPLRLQHSQNDEFNEYTGLQD